LLPLGNATAPLDADANDEEEVDPELAAIPGGMRWFVGDVGDK